VRSIAIVAGALFALSFPVAAHAGENCAHSKSAAVSASADGTLLANPHAACSEACPQAAKAEGSCSCGHATTAAEAKQDGGSEAVTKVPAASDAFAVTQ
jgi:hypothetical protein